MTWLGIRRSKISFEKRLVEVCSCGSAKTSGFFPAIRFESQLQLDLVKISLLYHSLHQTQTRECLITIWSLYLLSRRPKVCDCSTAVCDYRNPRVGEIWRPHAINNLNPGATPPYPCFGIYYHYKKEVKHCSSIAIC